MRRIARVALLLVLASWASPGAAQQPPNAKLAKLQAAQAANPSSVAANRDLGKWYYDAGRFAEARVPLEQARKLDPKDGTSALYAGLAAEKTNDYTAAKDAYNSYLAIGRSAKVKTDIRSRLLVVTREEAKAAAKTAIAREAQIAQVAGSPTTVAVLPFKANVVDQTLMPLERGLADLVITDLGKVKRLTVVERDRIQAIADEIQLSKGNQVDRASAVRAGKLIQAGRIVQGTLQNSGGTSIQMGEQVYNAQTAQVTGAGGNQNGDLAQIFAMEKAVVKQVFTDLNITLTPAEQQEVDRRPTSNLQAFLAYSRGLQAEDEGRIDEAARFFENARSLDPGFGAALLRAQSASSSTAKLETSIRNSGEVAGTAGPAINSTLSSVVGDVNPTTTNSVAGATTAAPPPTVAVTSQATGIDQPVTRTGQVTIVIKRP
ncbi:MAG: CsgG/HfaB family protein [Gemmatimonadales bacterium]